MKKRVLTMLLTGILTLALAVCVGDSNMESKSTASNTTSQGEQGETPDTASDTMDETAYMEKVDALPDAINDFGNDMAEIMATIYTATTQEDLDALLEPMEDLRVYVQPFIDFAVIDNPPEKYADTHRRLADACTQMSEVLNEYVDLMKGILEGTASDEDAQTVADKLSVVAEEIVQAGKAVSSIK